MVKKIQLFFSLRLLHVAFFIFYYYNIDYKQIIEIKHSFKIFNFGGNTMKNIFVIVGKSGSGKSTLAENVCKRLNISNVVMTTSRPK